VSEIDFHQLVMQTVFFWKLYLLLLQWLNTLPKEEHSLNILEFRAGKFYAFKWCMLEMLPDNVSYSDGAEIFPSMN